MTLEDILQREMVPTFTLAGVNQMFSVPDAIKEIVPFEEEENMSSGYVVTNASISFIGITLGSSQSDNFRTTFSVTRVNVSHLLLFH